MAVNKMFQSIVLSFCLKWMLHFLCLFVCLLRQTCFLCLDLLFSFTNKTKTFLQQQNGNSHKYRLVLKHKT